MTLALAAGSGYRTTSPTSGTVSIADNDTVSGPSISIGDMTVTEGNSGTSWYQLTVTLSAASSTPITVDFATLDGTAKAGSDYLATSGTLTFAPGVTQQTITIQIVNDKTKESTETFSVVLSNPTVGATLAKSTATVTILDNDKHLTASALGPGSTATLDPLAPSVVQPLLDAALAAWRAAGTAVDTLGPITIRIAALPGAELAEVDGTTIVLDADAAGWGWSTDPTTVTPGRMDLETVLLHEVGHLLGYEHGATGFMHDVMQPTLEPGTRRVLVPAPLPVAPVRTAPVGRSAPVPVLPIAPVAVPARLSPVPGSSTAPLGALLALLVTAMGLAWVSLRPRASRAPQWLERPIQIRGGGTR